MTAKNSNDAVAYEEFDDFEILCDGNFVWVPNDSKQDFTGGFTGIGKTQIDRTVYIGEVRRSDLYVPYKSGEARVNNFLKLFDKNKSYSRDVINRLATRLRVYKQPSMLRK